MNRRALYVVCGLVLAPIAALGVTLAMGNVLAWPLALAGTVVLGLALRRPRREIAIVAALSAVVALFVAALFFLLVWTGIVHS